MATAVIMPKQGQSVESCIIVEWKRQPGDAIAEGDILCEVETDKAVLEVPSPLAGTLLAVFFQAGDDVPVLTNMAAIGAPGEPVDSLRPDGATVQLRADEAVGEAAIPPPISPEPTITPSTSLATPSATPPRGAGEAALGISSGISPRARSLAQRKGVEVATLQGSGPSGRIIERDVQAALVNQPKLTPVAKAMVERGGFSAPTQGSGPGGRVMARDLAAGEANGEQATAAITPPPVGNIAETAVGESEVLQVIPLRGVRKVVAERMLASLQTTAQLTLHATADARALLALRKRLKASNAALGLQGVTINDLILFAVSRVVPLHPVVNATLIANTITQIRPVHLGFAVDTPRGLLVPVIRRADTLTLRALAQESKRLATATQQGNISPDEMTGGTFTVTNLGNLGIEQFTPVLNVPQVAILGVGNVNLKPVEVDGELEFIPHVSLSLTINHQVVDGAPGARFLQALTQGIADLELLLAV